MSVVVSDTSPLHYLILCSAETILPGLFHQVVIPPTVFRELQQPNTPSLVRQWARSLPTWAAVQTPKALNLSLDVDAGELEAICLAQEIKADAVLMDDRAGRNAAIHCGLAVVARLVCWNKRRRGDLLNCRKRWNGFARRTQDSTLN